MKARRIWFGLIDAAGGSGRSAVLFTALPRILTLLATNPGCAIQNVERSAVERSAVSFLIRGRAVDGAHCRAQHGLHASSGCVGACPFALPLAHRPRFRLHALEHSGAAGFSEFSLGRETGRMGNIVTPRPWLQGLCFAPVFLLLWTVFHLPLAILGHHISLAYGQSIQGWGSWLVDWIKALLLDLISGTVAFSVVFALIRKSRRWWLWLWVIVATDGGSAGLCAAAGG